MGWRGMRKRRRFNRRGFERIGLERGNGKVWEIGVGNKITEESKLKERRERTSNLQFFKYTLHPYCKFITYILHVFSYILFFNKLYIIIFLYTVFPY
jgi:hypothetical protein